MEIEIDDVCRLCLKEGGEYENIFSLKNGSVIAQLVIFIVPTLIIEETDKLPKQICIECLQVISRACELREKSVESEEYLNSLLKETFIVEAEEDLNLSSAKNDSFKVLDTVRSSSMIKVSSAKVPNVKDAVSCFICNIVLSRKSLSRHMKTIHNQQDFRKKDHDGAKFIIQEAFEKEAKTKFNLEKKTQVQDVSESSKKPRRRRCKWCSKRFKKFSFLNKHVIEFHAENYLEKQDTKPIGCSFCVARFRTIKSMKTHLQIEHDINPNSVLYYCNHCPFSTNDKSDLEIHLKEKHLGISGKPFQCTSCEKQFMNQKNLRIHLFKKHDIADSRTYFCDNCSFQSRQKSK